MEINSLVTEIAGSSEEQARGLAEVNTAVGEMDQVTQQNAAMVEQATAASQNLEGEMQRLADLMGHFTLRQGAIRPEALALSATRAAA
jgi:methyl-accepting chemotaxis protein